MHRIQTGAHRVAHRLVPGVWNLHRRQLARPMQPRQTGRIPPIRLQPVARPLWNQRWRHHNAFVPARRQVTLDAIAARARFVTNPKPDALAAKLAHQAIQGRWRVGNPTIFPDLTA
jgi:hypothetical protein